MVHPKRQSPLVIEGLKFDDFRIVEWLTKELGPPIELDPKDLQRGPRWGIDPADGALLLRTRDGAIVFAKPGDYVIKSPNFDFDVFRLITPKGF